MDTAAVVEDQATTVAAATHGMGMSRLTTEEGAGLEVEEVVVVAEVGATAITHRMTKSPLEAIVTTTYDQHLRLRKTSTAAATTTKLR